MNFFISVALASALIINCARADMAHKILILGDSITEGYGVAKDDSYPEILARDLKPAHPSTEVIGAGIGGSTSASAVSRLKWGLKSHPDIVVLALGGNDGLRGLRADEMKKNLSAAIDLAKSNGAKVLLAGMKAPPNLGKNYTRAFEAVFKDVARKKKVALLPFLLEGVAGIPSLNQQDGIHPNEEGQKIVARTVQKYLEPML